MRNTYTQITAAILLVVAITSATAKEAYIQNKGQIVDQHRKPNPAVLYLYNGSGLNMQLRKTGFSYDVHKTQITGKDTSTLYHRVDLDFVNTYADMHVIKTGESKDYYNYYTEYTGEQGITNVHSYDHVQYQNVWKGIDIDFILNEEKGTKYNFIIHPGAKLSDIKLNIKGADNIAIKDNELQLQTSITTLHETVPYSYYTLDNGTQGKTEIKAGFILNADGTYGITTTDEIPTNTTVVIDPVPDTVWGTYFGGWGSEVGYNICNDKWNNIYFAGTTSSINNIATTGAHNSTLNDLFDAFFAKFNAAGRKLWATYYGGSKNDTAAAICVDTGNQYIFIAGSTYSDNGVATTGVHKPAYSKDSDGFIAKFTMAGIRIWATYYGDSGHDRMIAMSVDRSGNLNIGGYTSSTTGIATTGTHKQKHANNYDVFITKFSPSGSRIWGTYFGGENRDVLTHLITHNDTIYTHGMTLRYRYRFYWSISINANVLRGLLHCKIFTIRTENYKYIFWWRFLGSC